MSICYNCFREIHEHKKCPFCGYEPALKKGKYPLALIPGTVLAGRYQIGRVLGQGGFGITYIAMDQTTRSRVAIKEYLPTEIAGRAYGTSALQVYSKDRTEEYESGKQQFLSEARTLSEFVGNEHIINIHGYFEENGTAYFAMEYMEGKTLKQVMEESGRPISVQQANRYLLPIMEALSWVHSKGIIHRDISPDNIMIRKDGEAKLIDFGAARYSSGEKSKSLDVILKHGFAPKEQYTRRGRQGPYTDVYAMAATYYYAITGRVPPDAIERSVEDEIISLLLTQTEVEKDENGSYWLYLRDHKIDITESLQVLHRKRMSVVQHHKSIGILFKLYFRCSGIFRILKQLIDKMRFICIELDDAF